MLVPFALDAESVVPDPDWTPAQQRVFHLAMLDTWKRVGLLVHDGDNFSDSRLKQAVDALPQKLAPLWQELLERLPLVPGPNGWNGSIGNTAECLNPVSAAARVAVVDDANAEVEFGLDEADLSKSLPDHNGLEISRFVAAPQAAAFSAAGALAGEHIQAGIPYGTLWNSRFAALAKAPIKVIALLDRFAISQHYECPQHYLSGLERFLRLLDGEASGARHVTIYSAWTAELKARDPRLTLEMIGEEMRALCGRLANHRVSRLRVVMLPNAVFGDLHHDRFVRFGDYVWDLGTGIKLFEGPAAPETSAASFKSCLIVPSYADAESQLSRHAQARSIEL